MCLVTASTMAWACVCRCASALRKSCSESMSNSTLIVGLPVMCVQRPLLAASTDSLAGLDKPVRCIVHRTLFACDDRFPGCLDGQCRPGRQQAEDVRRHRLRGHAAVAERV